MDDNTYIASLGTPQAVVASRDLRTWYPLYIHGFDNSFIINVEISKGKEYVVYTTGKTLGVIGKYELGDRLNTYEPVMVGYNAYIDRILGLLSNLKRKLIYGVNGVIT